MPESMNIGLNSAIVRQVNQQLPLAVPPAVYSLKIMFLLQRSDSVLYGSFRFTEL